MLDQVLVNVISIAALAVVMFFILRKRIFQYFSSIEKKITENNIKILEERNREILKNERERLFEINDEKIRRSEQYLDSRKDLIKEMIERIDSEINKSRKKIEETEKERINEFSSLKTIFEEHKKATEMLKESTDNLKNILSNNQLRGRYGEEIAENILKMLGFVKGIDYVVNLSQETNYNRPDLAISLPDKTKLNVDVKFPYQSLVRYQETDDQTEKEKHLAMFSQQVREKVKQVASRDYINPEEKTLDFVILFVPNEMIFSFICDKFYTVSEEAMKKKVIITGPFSFVAILKMIRQSYDSFKIQDDLSRIVVLVKKFKEEFLKYNSELDKLGLRIKSASEQYDKVSFVRTKKLIGTIEKIGNESRASEIEKRI